MLGKRHRYYFSGPKMGLKGSSWSTASTKEKDTE